MNSAFNTTVCTCSAESLFQKYKKISEKAVNLGSFLYCSAHIFSDIMVAYEKLI